MDYAFLYYQRPIFEMLFKQKINITPFFGEYMHCEFLIDNYIDKSVYTWQQSKEYFSREIYNIHTIAQTNFF